MKVLVLIFLCFLSFGFVANKSRLAKDSCAIRCHYTKIRPRPYKIGASTCSEINLNSFEIKFYDNNDFKGQPPLVWSKDGVALGGQTICGWKKSRVGKPIIDPLCPEDLPFGSSEDRKLTVDDYPEDIPAGMTVDLTSCNVATYIEMERFEGNLNKKKSEGDIGVISYKGKEYFFDFNKLKRWKWYGYRSEFNRYKELTRKNLNNPGFKKLFNGMKQCVQKRDPVCMEKYSQTGFRVEMKTKWGNNYIVKGKDKIIKFWQYYFNEEFERREFDHIFSQTSFPCISVVDSYSTGKDSLIVSGEEYYIEFEKRFGSKDPNDWRFSEVHYMDNQAYPEGMKYCDVKIHPTPVPEPTIDMTNAISMTLYEWKQYAKEKKESGKDIPAKPWIDAYKKLQKREGKGMKDKEWFEEYKKRGLRIVIPE